MHDFSLSIVIHWLSLWIPHWLLTRAILNPQITLLRTQTLRKPKNTRKTKIPDQKKIYFTSSYPHHYEEVVVAPVEVAAADPIDI